MALICIILDAFQSTLNKFLYSKNSKNVIPLDSCRESLEKVKQSKVYCEGCNLPVIDYLKKLKRIDLKKDKLNGLNSTSLDLLKNEMYIKFIYYTVALNGNTMTLDETQKTIETIANPNKLTLEQKEILGVDSALRYLNQTLAKNNSDIQIRDILEIHKRTMELIDPVNAGTFRKTQVFVGEHIPPKASDIEFLLDNVLKISTLKTMHPIDRAAYIHQKIMFIYPFVNDNTTISILLMNLIFIRHGYPLVTIKKEKRSQYFNLLENAHRESYYRPFYNFICHIVEDTINLYLQECDI